VGTSGAVGKSIEARGQMVPMPPLFSHVECIDAFRVHRWLAQLHMGHCRRASSNLMI